MKHRLVIRASGIDRIEVDVYSLSDAEAARFVLTSGPVTIDVVKITEHAEAVTPG